MTDEQGGGIGLLLGAWADFGKKQDRIISLLGQQPVHKVVGTSGTTTATGTTLQLVIPQVPAPGRIWYMDRFLVRGNDGHTSITGIADVYIGPGQDDDVSAQVYSALAIPTIIEEGRFHNPMHANEHIYALCYNLPNNQQVSIAALVWEWRVESQEALTI